MIHLQQITKVFASGAHTVRALDGVTLHIAPGRVFGVIGSSGAGKSTLMGRPASLR